jgi:hypothetical protein
LGERHGAAARDLQQCRSVEAAEHDAEASVERHLAEHLRRWRAGGENCLGHPRLLLAELRRETFLEQFYDLTWRPGVDVRRAALIDLLPEGSPHRPSSRRSRPNTDGGQKRTLPRSCLPAMIVACPRPQRLPESRRDAKEPVDWKLPRPGEAPQKGFRRSGVQAPACGGGPGSNSRPDLLSAALRPCPPAGRSAASVSACRWRRRPH